MIKPIKKGDLIALVQPSGAIRSDGGFSKAVAEFETLGYRVWASDRMKYGNLAGTDRERADELNYAFSNPEIKAIMCMKGGYGTPRILDMLDYDMIRENPKPFYGYSDITALHIAFNEKCNMVTFHAPMPASDFPLDERSRSSLLRALEGNCELTLTNLNVINEGSASGILCGGNLTLVAGSLGTPYDLDASGKILLLEDIGEKTYRLDHMFTQLRLAGVFEKCAGVVLGDFTDCPVEYPEFGFTLDEIVRDIIAPCGKPVVSGLPAGHGKTKLTFALGAECKIDGDCFTQQY